MRPRGEVRQVLLDAFGDGAPCTKRDVAQAARVGYAVADYTVRNMVYAGELRRCGAQKMPGSKVWEGLYERNPEHQARLDQAQATIGLEQVMVAWVQW